jgi:D-alanyl-lipoteichoic acid acyltransferase DltB (MBOAT superfamily)
VTNLAVLFFFKYMDFLLENINHFLQDPMDLWHLILPIGISFYIFQALSYLIDIYLGKIKPETHLGYFLLYLSFFPKVLQGPIERANTLLPQFKTEYVFNEARLIEGLKLIMMGLVKKLVIADRLAVLVTAVFDHITDFSGLPVLLAVYAFTFQIYFDFAGYTDVARGVGKLFGIELSENFASPYLSTSIQEFWRRWHITFSVWLKDYLFTPLLAWFRDYRSAGVIAAAMATFAICGLWHGASWGFVAFGVIHGCYMAGSILTLQWRDRRIRKLKIPLMLVRGIRIFVTFHMIAFSFIFFRSRTIGEAGTIIARLWGAANGGVIGKTYSVFEMLLLGLALAMVVLGERRVAGERDLARKANGKGAWYFYYGLLTNLAIFFSVKTYAPFIYFQF